MTKKELIKYLEKYPDDIELKILPDNDLPEIMLDLTPDYIQERTFFSVPFILFNAD